MVKLKVGIIGAGRLGTKHAQDFATVPDVKITAVADTVPEKGELLRGKYEATFYPDYNKMLAKEKLDAVAIALPHSSLSEAVVAAAQSGVHVLCQKPMGCNYKEGLAAVEACKRAGMKLMVGGQRRYRADYQKLHELIKSGELGDVYLVEGVQKFKGFTATDYPDWYCSKRICGGGALQNFTHILDMIRWVSGKEIAEVFATMGRYYHSIEGEDTAILGMRFDDGTIGNCTYSWSTTGGGLEMTGTKGRAKIENNVVYLTKDDKNWNALAVHPPDSDERLALDHYFIRCIREDLEPSPSGEEYLGVIATVEAAYTSFETKKLVTTEEVRFRARGTTDIIPS